MQFQLTLKGNIVLFFQLLQNVTCHNEQEVTQAMPNRKAILQRIRRARSACYPPEPENPEVVSLMHPWDKTVDGVQFLLKNGVSEDGGHVLIFATMKDLRVLCASELVLGDGTFKTVPKQYSQLYTLHAWSSNDPNSRRIIPLVYILATKKSEETYHFIFNVSNEVLATASTYS